MDNMYRVYGVKPSARANMIGESQYATKENFDKLKDYSKELDMYSIKNGKHMFTDEDFATIAYYTAYKDEHMKRTLGRLFCATING